jgi:hypothetical protein
MKPALILIQIVSRHDIAIWHVKENLVLF